MRGLENRVIARAIIGAVMIGGYALGKWLGWW